MYLTRGRFPPIREATNDSSDYEGSDYEAMLAAGSGWGRVYLTRVSTVHVQRQEWRPGG